MRQFTPLITQKTTTSHHHLHPPSAQRTKMPILCSGSLKTGVSDPKSAQKPRFCARNARKQGFQRAKKHKNADFVLEKPENGGSESQKSTKTPILCSKCPKTRVPKGKSAQKCRFCAREDGDWHLEDRKLASGSATVAFLQITAHAPKI